MKAIAKVDLNAFSIRIMSPKSSKNPPPNPLYPFLGPFPKRVVIVKIVYHKGLFFGRWLVLPYPFNISLVIVEKH